MPTTYTAPIEDGTITDVNEYAALCARAFGAFMHQRGDSSDASLKYPEMVHDSYYAKSLSRDRRELRRWNSLSEEAKYAEWSEYYVSSLVNRAEAAARRGQEVFRYQSMLAQVLAVDVPSQLENFKNFMIEQIETSMPFENSVISEWHTPREYVEWCDEKSSEMLRSIARGEKSVLQEQDRYKEQCEYIDLMAKTFGFEVEK